MLKRDDENLRGWKKPTKAGKATLRVGIDKVEVLLSKFVREP
jgi:hypothetical protein